MKRSKHYSGRKREEGVALLLSIFVLLVLSVVAISMIVASGSESSLAGNYRSSTNVYYAAMAGLEEGRGRMLAKNPDYFNNTVAGFFPTPGTPLPWGTALYIVNPAAGDAAITTTTYPDTEYAAEFAAAPGIIKTITSTSPNSAGVPVPLYKWVRITPATEASIGRDVNNDAVLSNSNATLLYYDTGHLPSPSLIVGNASPPCSTPCYAQQVFQVTAFAVLPNKSEKLVQYTVAAKTFNLNFPSALTFGTNGLAFSGANSNPYQVDGQDGSGSPPAVPGCTPNPNNYKNAITATNPADVTTILAGLPRPGNYTGLGGTTPNVAQVPNGGLSSALSSPAAALQTIQNITAAADVVINGNATQANMPAAMSVNNPMTIVVNGDFSMTGNYTGYGLLVVTGDFSYSGNTGWKGIVLVIGDGTTTYNGQGGGNNEFDGAIYVATIWDANHNLLAAFGPASYDISGGGGNGIYYNSCWVNSAQQPSTYTILGFKEIPYNE
jgi:hypothetical protein